MTEERITWESSRIAAAFGITRFGRVSSRENTFLGKTREGVALCWHIDAAQGTWDSLVLGGGLHRCTVFYDGSVAHWVCLPYEKFNAIMARGLFCLGLEEDEVIRELNYPLTKEQTVAFQGALPREFWPPQWSR